MSFEIERRFLVTSDGWRSDTSSQQKLRQCYLMGSDEGITVRVRITSENNCFLTLKTPFQGITRYEFEYSIPQNDAELLWNFSNHRLIKTRYQLDREGGEWIVDCFEGANSPLVIAEVELPSEDFPVEIPEWCGREITREFGFSNASLAQIPFSEWSIKQQNASL